MKKLLSMLLCIVFVCFALVGCAEDVIGEYLKEYEQEDSGKKTIEHLNFYIVTGKETSEDAEKTVSDYINSYLSEKYGVKLNIVYCTAEEYTAKVYADAQSTDEAVRPDIVLINSKEMFDKLHYADDALVALNDFYNHRDFKKINTIVDKALLSASTVVDPVTGVPTYYTVPNNHVIGEYTYVVIDKTMARDILHYSDDEILEMNTTESIDELKNAIVAYYNSPSCSTELSEEEFVNQYVKVATGTYNDRLLFEYGVSTLKEANEAIANNELSVNFVNVKSYPLATKDEAFLSAFAIVKMPGDDGKGTEKEQAERNYHYTKSMQIIYALNSDAQLQNMLQYGYVGTNYTMDKDEKYENTGFVILAEEGDDVIYRMNPIHTGNIFKSYYCDKIVWNDEVFVWNQDNSTNILKQNADSYQPTAEVKLENELVAFNLKVTTFNSNEKNKLPIYSDSFNDIVVKWDVPVDGEEEAVVQIDAHGNIILTEKFTETTTVTAVATITCSGTSVTKEFEITLVKVAE